MKVYKSSLYHVWLVVLIFLSTIQDLKTANLFGEIARNPIIFLTPFFFLVEVKFLKRRYSKEFKLINLLFLFFIILLSIVSFTNILIWYFREGTMVAMGENIIVKTLKIIAYYSLILLFFRHSFIVVSEIGNLKKVSMCFFAVLLIYFPILLYEVNTLPDSFADFHASTPLYHRVRLFTAESSWTGSIIIFLVAGSSATYNSFKKYPIKLLVVISFLLCYFAFTTSKMFLIAILLVCFAFVMVNRMINVKVLIPTLLILFFSSFFIVPRVVEHLKNDIQHFTSVITRSSAFANSFYVPLYFPLGTGGLYYAYFVEYIDKPASFIASLIGGKIDEISDWKESGSDINISPASELGQWTIMLGIPGFFLFFFVFVKLLKFSKPNKFLLLGMLYFFVTGVLMETFMTKPNVILFFALVTYLKSQLTDDYFDNKIDEKNTNS